MVASVAVGTAMFGTTAFLSQYTQVARGFSPTASGLLMIPMVLGLFLASTIVGRIVTRTGICGAMGVSVLGAILAAKVDHVAPVAIRHAYGTGIAENFLVAAPLGLVALVALIAMRETPLGRRSGMELAREGAAA